MTEFQILSQFNAFLISNAIYLMVFTFLLLMAFRGVLEFMKMEELYLIKFFHLFFQ